MKKALTVFAAMAFTCLLAMPAAAQYPNQQELNNFNAFLNSHPKVAAQLHKNPGLIDNAAYLDQHPQLHSFLADHDQLRRAIQTHPGMFENRGGRYSYGWGKGGWNPAWSHEPSREEWERMHNYGYTDPDDHQWHDREWWEHHKGDWVKQHHPNWEAANAKEHQKYEQWQEHHGDHDEDHDEHHDHGQHKGWNNPNNPHYQGGPGGPHGNGYPGNSH